MGHEKHMTPPGICIGKQKFASRGSIKNIVQMPRR